MEIEKVNVLGVGISVLDQGRAREFLFIIRSLLFARLVSCWASESSCGSEASSARYPL